MFLVSNKKLGFRLKVKVGVPSDMPTRKLTTNSCLKGSMSKNISQVISPKYFYKSVCVDVSNLLNSLN
jgi:hypothetical protein